MLRMVEIEEVGQMNAEKALSLSSMLESCDVVQCLEEAFPRRGSFVLRYGVCFCGCCNDERLHQRVVVLKECRSLQSTEELLPCYHIQKRLFNQHKEHSVDARTLNPDCCCCSDIGGEGLRPEEIVG